MNDVATETQSGNEGRFFRPLIGLLCVIGSLLGFGGLYFVEVPAGNEKAMMFALGIVFGWGSMVVSSEYGATATGRKVAESAIRKIERQDIASGETPAGTEADPLRAKIVNTKGNPANVKESKSRKP